MRERAKTGSGHDAEMEFDALLPVGKPYRILIVDDHPLVRRGVRSILETHPSLDLTEASSGPEALEMIKTSKPDLALVDLTMPEMDGLELTAAIRREAPETQVVVLSMHFSEEVAREVLRAGALGYVLKSDPDDEVLAAVDHARRRQPFFTTQLAMTMAHNFMAGGPGQPMLDENGEPTPGLTERELQVVQMLAEGRSNKEIAAQLSVSIRTIESHRSRLMHKLKYTNLSELVKFAVRNNLVDL